MGGVAMTAEVQLRRFARDIRLLRPPTDPDSAQAAAMTILGPFGGRLQPAVATRDWPPAVLEHLALADILARAIAPPGPGGQPDRQASTEPDKESPGVDSAPEPIVREVIRESVDPPVDPTRPGTDERFATAPTDHPPDIDPAMGAGPALTGPRTILRAPTRPGAASPPEFEDRVDKLVSVAETDSTSWPWTVADAFSRSARRRRGEDQATSGDSTIGHTVRGWPREPVERTVAATTDRSAPAPDAAMTPNGEEQRENDRTQPAPDPASGAGVRTLDPFGDAEPTMTTRAETGIPSPSSSGPIDASDPTPGSPDAGASSPADLDSGVAGDRPSAPAMTVRQRPRGADPEMGDSRTGQAMEPTDAGQALGSPATSTAAAVADPEESATGAASPPLDEAGSPWMETVIERHVTEAVADPGVIDDLYHELERRRRIEQERRGDR